MKTYLAFLALITAQCFGQTAQTVRSQTTPNSVMIVVAASNSINKASANYVATGTSDQTTINAAINSCPATLAASPGPAQCTVVLQPGVYNVSASVVIDTDDVTLTGEGHCMWGGWNNVWTNTSTPNGAIGTGCSQLKASATGFPIVAIKHVNVPAGTGANANNTHRGISIKQLYIVGNSYLNQGIVTVGNGGTCNTSYTYDGTTITGCTDDNVEIADNVIQRTNLGIGVSLDTPHIHGNSVQDNNGPGEMICGWFARVHDELVFDNQGPLIIACSVGGKYTNNTLGDSSLDGIDFEVNSSSASNNSFLGIVGSAMHIKSVSGTVLNGNTVDYATAIDFNSGGQLPSSADAILEDSGASNNSITNNNLQSAVNQTGYAINAQGTQGTVTGNWTSGTWRFGNVGPPVFVNLSHTTNTDSGAANSLTWATGAQPGFRPIVWDTFASNLPSYSIAGGNNGANTGIIFETKNPTYGIPTIQLGATATGGALDLFSFRSWQATNTYDQFFASANAAATAALHRLYITGHATTGLVQVENATLTVGGTEGSAGPVTIDTTGAITTTGVETLNSTAANPLVVNSTNTGGTNVVLNNTSSGGHSFNLFSTGSASANAGAVGVYDNTASRLMFTVDGGTAQRLYTFSTGLYGWSSGDGSTGFAALDTGISRCGAGHVCIGNGTAGSQNGELDTINATITNLVTTTVSADRLANKTTANSDMAGFLTLSGGTATYTFGVTYFNSPACVASDNTAIAAVKVATTTTTLTVTGTGTDLVSYVCVTR